MNNVLDWEHMVISLRYSGSIGFDNLPLLRQYRKHYGQLRRMYDDWVAIQQTDHLMRLYHHHPAPAQLLWCYLRQICLRAFRRDVFQTIRKSLQPGSMKHALNGSLPFSAAALRDSISRRPAFALADAPNQRIREYNVLFQFLFEEDDEFDRGHWAHKGYRLLYRLSWTMIQQHSGADPASLWRMYFKDYLRRTHWLLPFPNSKALVSTDSSGCLRWWSNYSGTIDRFNQDHAHQRDGFVLAAETMYQWPPAEWNDHIVTKGSKCNLVSRTASPWPVLTYVIASDALHAWLYSPGARFTRP